MNTNVEVTGLTRLGIKLKSTAPEADALTTRSSELLMPAMPTSSHFQVAYYSRNKNKKANTFM